MSNSIQTQDLHRDTGAPAAGAGLVIRPALAVFALAMALLTLILINGYALNLLSLPAQPFVLLVLIVVELGFGIRRLIAQRVRLAGDPLELAGFLFVVAGTWLYFVLPAWPTLIPPSYSGDGAIHYAFTTRVFATGWIISDDPGGPSLIAATLAHWVDWPPLSMLHLVGALWIALAAGAVYGIACSILPERRECKAVALASVFALYAAWNYFAGIALLTNYFYSQMSGQLFIVALVWFLHAYRASHARLWETLVVTSLLALAVLYELWLVLAGTLFAWAVVDEWLQGGAHCRAALHLARTGLSAAAVLATTFALNGRRFLPGLDRLQVDASVFSPSIECFGGPVLVAVALIGLCLAWREERYRVVVVYALITVVQTAVLLSASVFLGAGKYWLNKSVFLWIYPLALCSVIALARALEWVPRPFARRACARGGAFVATGALLTALVLWVHPPPAFALFDESDVQVALWAKANLDTRHVHYIGTKSLNGMWIGSGLWDEVFPGDLLVGLAALGPKTYEEWRDDPGWGEYLLVSDTQHHPIGPAERIVYRRGNSLIVQKPVAPVTATITANTPRFGNVFGLAGYRLTDWTRRAGETVTVNLQLITNAVPKREVVWRLQLRDLNNAPVAEARLAPLDNRFPLQRWPGQVVMTQTLALDLPQDIAPGVYDLQLGLYQVRDGEPQRFTAANGTIDDVWHLERIKVPLPVVPAAVLDASTPDGSRLDDKIQIRGFVVTPSTPVHRGDAVKLDLYWQCLEPVAANYTTFVHLLDAQGTLKAQSDRPPRDGLYPTSVWVAGEIIADTYSLTIPADASPGDYALQIGMYPWPSLTPVPVRAPDGRSLGDRRTLPVTVRVIP